MTKMMPWDYHADLQEHRLVEIASVLRQARNSALELHDPDGGDSSWSLGCRCFDRGRNRLNQAWKGQIWDWLTVTDPSLHFRFKIGNVECSFYRGDHDDPRSNALTRADPAQFELFTGENTLPPVLTWTFAVETDEFGSIERIVFVGLNSDLVPECVWVAPEDSTFGFVAPIDGTPPAPIELPPADVSFPDEDADESGSGELS